MKKPLFNTALKFLALAIIPAMVACGGPSAEEAEAELCEDLGELATALQGLNDISAQSTVNELEDAQAEIAEAYEEVQSAAADVEAARIDELESAYADYESTVNSISGRDTLGEAAITVVGASGEVAVARQQLYSDLICQ